MNLHAMISYACMYVVYACARNSECDEFVCNEFVNDEFVCDEFVSDKFVSDEFVCDEFVCDDMYVLNLITAHFVMHLLGDNFSTILSLCKSKYRKVA